MTDKATIERFYAARKRFAALRREITFHFRWSEDGQVIEWAAADGRGGASCYQLGGSAPHRKDHSLTLGTQPAPRTFLRETYLVPEFPMPEAVSPDGRWFASLVHGEILLQSSDGEERALTSGATEDKGWDIETVNCDPWSPDGRWLFACSVDRRGVQRSVRTRFGPDGSVAVDFPRTQRSGGPLDLMQPHFVSSSGTMIMRVDIDDMQDKIVRLVGWLPDSSAALFARFSRQLDRVELVLAEPASGNARIVYVETARTFLRSCQVVWTEHVGCWILSAKDFLWVSERDGWRNLYAGRFDGKGTERITSGRFVVRDVVHWNDHDVWFRASIDGARPYDVHLFKVPRHGGEAKQLTTGDGEHEISLSPDGGHFVDTYSTPARAPRAVVREKNGAKVADLFEVDPTANLGPSWWAPEEFTAVAADGETTLHGLIYKPARFDPSKQYPLIHWVYGGPQLTAAPHQFPPLNDNQVLHHSLADAGFYVMVIDGRGTPGRSKAFQDVVWRSFAPHVVDDQSSALRQLLEANSCIDPKRIGLMGRSWGAYFALQLLANAPDLYCAGVLVVPGLDPYGGLIYEPYLGLPQDDSRPYREAEPWSLPGRLKSNVRLLLMAGTLDSPQQWDMQRLSTLLVGADISHHMVTFAEQEHVFEEPALRYHDRAVLEFFEATLC